jgi:uncharacterized protein (DUF302 family)
MKITVTTTKTIGQALADLHEAVKANQFGVINTLDLQAKLKEKGVLLAHGCFVVDVCNPHKASAVLAWDPSVSAALPCRISVYERDGKTWFTTIKPTAMLAGLTDADGLEAIAVEVEQTLVRIMESAAK